MKVFTKVMVVGALVAMVGASGAYISDTQLVKAKEVELDEKILELNSIYDTKNGFFNVPISEANKKVTELKKELQEQEVKVFFSKWVSKENIENKKQALNKNIQETDYKLETYKELSEVFTNKDFELSKLNKIVLDKEDLEKADLKELQDLKQKYSRNVVFDTHVRHYISLVESQKEQVETAEKSLEKVFKEDKVVSTNKESIKEAKKTIETLPNKELKEELLNDLKVVEKKHQEEVKKKEAEEKKRKEKERLAEIARQEKEAEEARIAEEQKAYNQAQSSTQTNTKQSNSVAPSTQQQATQQEPSIPSSGVYIKGLTAPISTYSVYGGAVEWYTPYAYLWTVPDIPSNYYLIDLANSLGMGNYVIGLAIGDSVYINGEHFTVTGSKVVPSGAYTSDIPYGHRAYLQTCLTSSSTSDMRIVTLD